MSGTTPNTDKRDVYGPTHGDIRGVLRANDVHEAPDVDLRAVDAAENGGTQDVTANRDFDTGLRLGLAAALNSIDSFEGRDRYDTFGWPTGIGPDGDFGADEYLALYLRNAYCRTVVDKPATTTWGGDPIITDEASETESEPETGFEKQVEKLARNHDWWAYSERVDRVAGIGEFGLLVLGLSDVTGDEAGDQQWAKDARNQDYDGLDDITNIKPVLQTQIEEVDWGGPNSERWGKPEYYHIDWSDDVDAETEGEDGPWKVHWTRAIDVPATRLLDDETKARPRAEPVLNNLIDIEKIRGAAAEIGYRAADYGLHINFDPEKVDPQAVQDGQTGEEFEKWSHGLQPQFTTVGGEVNTLGGTIPDPQPVVEPNVDEIAAQTGIPKKEFRGNDSGEVAGAEADKESYHETIGDRRIQYAGPHIARNSLDHLRMLSILPDPIGAFYDVGWPEISEQSEEEQASIRESRANVVASAGALIGLTGDDGRHFVETGEIPERDTDGGNEWVDEEMSETPPGFGEAGGDNEDGSQ